jgi:CRP/FNR family transcriptional regulator, dissimilatory nitrate respiration regulator
MIAIMSDTVLPLLLHLPGRKRAFAAGEALFRVGDPVRNLHVVCEGQVHLVRHQIDGAALILQRAGAGDVLAEASLHSRNYHCDAVAERNSLAWTIRKRDFQESLRTDKALSEAWSQHLAHEVQKARLHAEILSLKTVAARVDSWVTWNGALPERGHWATVAEQIGVSPEALYRELAKRRN